MPKGISGSGGVDDSELKGIKNALFELVKIQKNINDTTVSPKGDDSSLRPVRKSLDTIRDEISEIGTSDVELWNTKTIQRSVRFAQEEINKIKRATHGFQDEFDDEIQIKKFIDAFKTLEIYGKRFGQDLTSEFKNAYDLLLSNINRVFEQSQAKGRSAGLGSFDYLGFTPDKINRLIEKTNKDVNNTLQLDIDYALDTDIAKARKAQYDEERGLAIESADEIERAERRKKDAMRQTRDELAENIKTKLSSINNSVKEGQYLDIDEKYFAVFQKQSGDLLITLEKMGYEVKDLEELLSQIGKKVYVPSDNIEEFKSNIINSSQEVKNLRNQVDLLERALSDKYADDPTFNELNRELDDAKYKIETLEEEIRSLQTELGYSVNYFDWSQKVEQVEKLTTEVEILKKTIDDLRLDNEILINENHDLQAFGGSRQNLEKEKRDTEDIASANKELVDSEKELSNIRSNSSQLLNPNNYENIEGILRLIAKHLGEIKTALGTVDDVNGFTNIITSVDILLGKLDEVYKKIGNGTYNVSINTAGSYGSPADAVISREREKMMSAYNQVVDAFGDESLMYTEIANTLNVGIDEFKSVYGREAIVGTTGEKNQLNLLRSFFQRFEEYRLKSQEFYEEKNEEIENDLRELSEGNALRVASKINYQNRKNKKDDVYTLKHKDVGIESLSKSQREYRISGLEKQRDYNIQKLNQLNALGGIGEEFLDEDSLNKEIVEVTDNAQRNIDELKNKSNEVLSDISQKLGEIKDIISEISKKDLFGELFEKLNSKLDEIVLKFENIISKVEIINSSPIDTQNVNKDIENVTNNEKIDEATESIRAEGEAAKNATKEKELFADANNKVAQSAENTAISVDKATKSIESEGVASKNNEGLLIEPDWDNTFQKDIDEYTKDILPDEEKLEQVSSKVAQKIADDFGATGKSVALLRDEVKQLFKTMQFGENIDLSNIVDILGSSPQVLNKYKDNYDLYYKVRDYVSKSKIKISSYDADEFGDEWNKVRGTIGLSVLNSTNGSDAESFIRELTDRFGNFLGEVNNTQDAIRLLYDYLANPPDLKKLFNIDLDNGLIDLLQNRIQAGAFAISENAEKLYESSATRDPIINKSGEILSDKSISGIDNSTKSITEEGNAAEEAAKKKEIFTVANKKLAESGDETSNTLPNAIAEIKAEGNAAENATGQINKVNDAIDGYIRRQRGDADSGNYDFTQAINKVVDKDVQVRTDENGNTKSIETMRVNYDKLSKEMLKTDTEIFKLQQQIIHTTQGNTSGLQKNLSILQSTKKTYEDLLQIMVQDSQYVIDDSQVKVLKQQLFNNLQFLQNIQDTKDSIEQLKANAQTVSLGFDKQIKNNALVDYVDNLKDLGLYSTQAEKEAIRLSNLLSQVGSKNELSNYNKQFKIFQQNYASTVEGSKSNINGLIREQSTAYKNIWSIRKQIAKLDSNKDANLIAELKTQEQEQKNIYLTKIKELDTINHQIAHEQVLNNYANIRKKTEAEIGRIKAAQSDVDVKNRFDAIISKYNEIKKLNTEIQGLISSGVSSHDQTVTDRESRINNLQTEISLISQAGFATEQLVDIQNAEAVSRQAVADAQAKQAARGILEQQQIEKTRNSLLKQASTLLSNGKLMKAYGDQVNAFIRELENTGIAKNRLEEIRIELTKIATEANLTGKTGKTFGQILKQRFTSLGAYIGTFASFYRIITGVRQAFTTITELDTQLVDLRKTTKMNTEELNEFYFSANKVAKQIGVTTSEIISQAAAWSRLNKIGHLCGNI